MKFWQVFGLCEGRCTAFEHAFFGTRSEAEMRLAEWVEDPAIITPELKCIECPHALTPRSLAVWLANRIHPDSFENEIKEGDRDDERDPPHDPLQ